MRVYINLLVQRSGMGYCGTKDIPSLKKSSKFVKITGSGIRESSSQCFNHKRGA